MKITQQTNTKETKPFKIGTETIHESEKHFENNNNNEKIIIKIEEQKDCRPSICVVVVCATGSTNRKTQE